MSKRNGATLAAALTFWALAAAGLQAEDSAAGQPAESGPPPTAEEDIFASGAFDQAVAESRQEEEQNRLETLFGGVFLSENSLATTAAFDGYTALGAFSGKAFTRVSVPGSGSLYLSYNFSHTLFMGEGGEVAYSIPGEDLFDVAFTLSEFHVSFDLAKVLFVRIGNQLIAWGPSRIWTPVDFINRERLDPQASIDLRAGKPGMRLHLPLKRSNLFLFADFSDTVAENPSPPPAYRAGNLFEQTNLGLRGDFTALGFEFGLSGYLGMDIQNRLGFDLSGRLLATDVYGELAFALPSASRESGCSSAAGFQRALGELKKWSLQGEIFYNSAGQQDGSAYATPADFIEGGYVPLYTGRLYAYAGIGKQDLFVPFLDGTLSGFMNISDLSCSLSLKGSFDIPGWVPFSVSLDYNGGGEGREFTIFSGDHALSLTVRMRFEF
jgi:hypothetical protein